MTWNYHKFVPCNSFIVYLCLFSPRIWHVRGTQIRDKPEWKMKQKIHIAVRLQCILHFLSTNFFVRGKKKCCFLETQPRCLVHWHRFYYVFTHNTTRKRETCEDNKILLEWTKKYRRRRDHLWFFSLSFRLFSFSYVKNISNNQGSIAKINIAEYIEFGRYNQGVLPFRIMFGFSSRNLEFIYLAFNIGIGIFKCQANSDFLSRKLCHGSQFTVRIWFHSGISMSSQKTILLLFMFGNYSAFSIRIHLLFTIWFLFTNFILNTSTPVADYSLYVCTSDKNNKHTMLITFKLSHVSQSKWVRERNYF